MMIASVFLVSLAALAFEVLLARFFSIALSHHLTFMVISITLFGFAAAGTCLGVIIDRSAGWVKKNASASMFFRLGIFYSVSALVVLFILVRLPLEFYRLSVAPIQLVYLTLAYVLPAIPFFIAGWTVSLAYAAQSHQSGRIYFANMGGSALGALVPAVLLAHVSDERLALIVAAIPFAGLSFCRYLARLFKNHFKNRSKDQSKSRSKKWGLLPKNGKEGGIKPAGPPARIGKVGLAAMGIFLIVIAFFPGSVALFQMRSSSYKSLSQVRQLPQTRTIQTKNSIRGRIDLVETPYLRYAPGLSLQWTEPLSARRAVFKDGDNQLVLYEPSLLKAKQWAPYTLSWAGYHLVNTPRHVLLLIKNGGSAIPCVAAANPKAVTIVVDTPHLADVLTVHYKKKVIAASAASFISKTKKKFDLIHVENWGSPFPGMIATHQDHMFTTGQFKRYLHRLTDSGVLMITRRLKLPPSDTLRLWATAYETLAEMGKSRPEDHLAVVRNWDHFVLTVSLQPFGSKAVSLAKWAQNLNFDLVSLPYMRALDANRFNRFDQSYYYLALERLKTAHNLSNTNQFFDEYLLDVTPQSDQRPFPNRFLKWTRLKEIYATSGSRVNALILSDEVVVVAVLIQAVLVSFILYRLPRWFGRNAPLLDFRQNLFFISVGAGFILYEIYFIKSFTQIFGDPIVSFTVVLSGLLIFSGIGGYLSERVTVDRLRPLLAGLVVFFFTIYWCHDFWVQQLIALSVPSQYTTAFLILLPAGVTMGLAFPVGMQKLLESPMQRAGAWAANGCASVVGAVVAAQMALVFGIPALVLLAGMSYAVTVWCCAR